MPDELPHVFLGPSLSLEEARRRCHAVWHGPATALSLANAVRDGGATALLLIDGLFESCPSVWHKEILWCLSRGVRVFGASSMGALRAAEMRPYGMRGIGAVYTAFAAACDRSHPFDQCPDELERLRRALPAGLEADETTLRWLHDVLLGRFHHDDDVAVLHAPAPLGHVPVTIALCDLVFRVANSPLSTLTCHAVLISAKNLSYRRRTVPAIMASLRSLSLPDSSTTIVSWLFEGSEPGQKHRDACTALDLLADWQGGDTTRPNAEVERSGVPRPTFVETRYWGRAFSR